MQEIEVKILNKKESDFDLSRYELIYDDKIFTTLYVALNGKSYFRFRTDSEFEKANEDDKRVRAELKISDDTGSIAKSFVEMSRNLTYDQYCFFSKVLKTLGFSKGIQTYKHRRSFSVDNCRVEFDIPISSKIPPFMEIEGPNEESIIKVANKLGILEEEFSKQSYSDLIAQYDKE